MSFKYRITISVLTYILLILFLNSLSTSASNSLIIELDSVELPLRYVIYEGSTYFDVIMKYNITNQGDTKYIATPQTNLLYPYMIVDVEGFYGEYEGMAGFCMCVEHTIETGVTSSGTIMTFLIPDYTSEKVPPGKIILWSDVDSHGHGYDIISINTTLYVNEDGTISTEPITETSIYEPILLTSLVFIVLVLYKRRKY